MDAMDGILLVPPDPRQILGRALWKHRYVVVARRSSTPARRLQSPRPSTDEYYISIFKSKLRHRGVDEQSMSYPIKLDEWELSQSYPVNAVADCQVQMVAHRKQGPVLPTLVVSIADKEKKRRSSRAAGLITKESSATMLWLRNPPDDHHASLHEWARFILSHKLPVSPESPASPNFSNPFASRQRDPSDYLQRPPSNQNNGRSRNLKSAGRDQAVAYSSESPSLRSKRSDISSPSSATYAAHMGIPIPDPNKYTTVLPTDLPSPANTLGEYTGEFIEGWTVAQGHTSHMGSPSQGLDGMQSFPTGPDSSSPPSKRETILDRAFQLRLIPGSQRELIPGEEKLTSLARFDALMQEADNRRRQREVVAEAEKRGLQSAWDLESSDESEEEEEVEEDDEDDAPAYGNRRSFHGSTIIPPHAQRALEFIADRHGPRSPRTPQPEQFDAGPGRAVKGPSRPHTAQAKTRPNRAQRMPSQPHLAGHGGLDVPSSSTSTSGRASSEDAAAPPAHLLFQPRPGAAAATAAEKRQSSSSAKRLSFTEFTKRLSSTSSLLLVQTNASAAGSRGSSEPDALAPPGPGRDASRGAGAAHYPRGGPPPRDRDREEWEKRCGWRGSVGVDGGFL